MNKDFLQLLMDRTGFPAQAQAAYRQAAGLVDPEQMDGIIRFFYENDCEMDPVAPLLEKMAEDAGVPSYTVWGLFLACAAERAHRDYLENGISETVFFDTFCDLRYKVEECWQNKGVWGNFVAFWYPIFYRCDIVKLGRLEYENILFNGPACTVAGQTLQPGDPVLSIHIPSSGEPFHQAARLESYRLAYDFFRERRGGRPLICLCHSWLLYPEYRKVLPANSNIVSFMDDFTILRVDDGPFADNWRVFGPDAEKPAAQLPETTSMQRAFKAHLMAGGKTGTALGALVFDGEKLLKD